MKRIVLGKCIKEQGLGDDKDGYFEFRRLKMEEMEEINYINKGKHVKISTEYNKEMKQLVKNSGPFELRIEQTMRNMKLNFETFMRQCRKKVKQR